MAKQLLNEIRIHRAWTVTIILTLLLGLWFLKPYLSLIALAMLVSYLTRPIYKWFMKVTKKRSGLSVTLTTFITLLILGIPFILILSIAILQGLSLIDSIDVESIKLGGESFDAIVSSIAADVNGTIANLSGINDAISSEGVIDFFKNVIPALLTTVFDFVFALVSGIPSFFVGLIIFVFVYVGLLTGAESMEKTIKSLSPFDDKVNDLYFKRMGLMASSMFKGQLFIAFLQGLGSALSLAIIGWGEYFWFFLILFTFMSIIPLGAGIVTIPLGIGLLFFGEVWQGLLVLATHFIYVTNIDNIRPKLVAKEAQMPAALTILAAFAGVAYFGLLGVIYGPIIMIFILTTIELYSEHQAEQKKKLASS